MVELKSTWLKKKEEFDALVCLGFSPTTNYYCNLTKHNVQGFRDEGGRVLLKYTSVDTKAFVRGRLITPD